MQLTILFDHPYWIALVEDVRAGFYYAGRFIFGSEPNDEQVYQFVQSELVTVMRRMTAGIPVEDLPVTERRINPKRQQRAIRRELMQAGLSSKAHEAIRLQIEAGKQERNTASREQREAQRDYKRKMAQEKAKEKHRGH